MIFKRAGKPVERQRSGRVPLNYYRSGPAEKKASPFVRKVNKQARARKYVMRSVDSVAVAVLAGGLIYSLFVNSTPRVQLNSAAYHATTVYQAAAARQLGSLKDRNKITLDESGVITSLQKQFPEIAGASLELPLLSETPVIHLAVAQPSFFLASGGAYYIVDSDGVAVAIASSLPQITHLTTLTDQSGFAAHAGQQVLSAQSVAFINAVLAQAKAAEVPVKSLVLPAQAEELDLYTTDHPYFVKFYLAGNPTLQSGQFLAARHNFDQTGKQPSQYLDVRIPGKVFYK